MIAAIVLAAGGSRRYGTQKLIVPIDGETVVHRSVRTVLEAGVDDVVVVTGHDGDAVRLALADLPMRSVPNARWGEGVSTSIATGVRALADGTEGALIVLGDQPTVPRTVIASLIHQFRASGAMIVAPIYRGVQGPPVLFATPVLPELLTLRGDNGARAVVERDPARVERVEFDHAVPPDIDIPGSLVDLSAQRDVAADR